MTQYNEKKGKKWPNIMRKGQNNPMQWDKGKKNWPKIMKKGVKSTQYTIKEKIDQIQWKKETQYEKG